MSAKFYSDGTSLDGWTKSGNININSNAGLPAPSISTPGGSYAYRDVSMAVNDAIEFDLYINPGQVCLCDLQILCDASGKNGTFLRFDARPNQKSGFAQANGWGIVSVPSINSKFSVPSSEYLHIKIETKDADSGILARVFVNNLLFVDWYNIWSGGSYIGIYGDDVSANGALWDNIIVYPKLAIEGNVTIDSGIMDVNKIFINDWNTGALIDSTIPDAQGNYSILVAQGDYLVTAIGPAGYRPLSHGPITVSM